MPNLRFQIGLKVRLKAAPSQSGIVIRVAENQENYLVSFGVKNQAWYPSADLMASEPEDLSPSFVSAREFLKDLALTKLNSQLTDTLYSYLASRTSVEPYQFKPVLKFLESREQRLLIADEVGLGKTIEVASENWTVGISGIAA